MPNYYKTGVWNCVCQVCGFKFKSDQIRKRWDGLLVCDKDFEQRHPVDFYKAPQERGAVPFTAPEPTENHRTVNYVDSSVGTQDNTIPTATNDNEI